MEKCTFGRGEGVCCFVKGEKEKKATDEISAIELQGIDRKKLRMEHKRQQLGLPRNKMGAAPPAKCFHLFLDNSKLPEAAYAKKTLAQLFRDGKIAGNINNDLFRWMKFNFEIRESLSYGENSL